MSDKKLVVVTGPTASGKTSVSIRLAKALNTEIISADSRQVYRKMDIGTAKASSAELKSVKHHFINILDPEQEYSAGQFGQEARDRIESLFRDHDHVILCGGSGLYIDAVIKGIDDSPKESRAIRDELNQLYETKGLEDLQERLKAKDPDAYSELDQQNPRRLIRMLEIIETSGNAYSESFQKVDDFDATIKGVILESSREELYERINQRVDEMIKAGLIDEVRSLYKLKGLNSLNTVGYKELFDHFDGELSLDEAISKIKQHSRNYAKRQLTWNKRYSDFERFGSEDFESILKYIQE